MNRCELERRAYESQQMHRQHLQDFITTFRAEKKGAAQDRKVGQAMSKQKVLDRMELLENPDEESTDRFSLRFPDPGLLRLPLIADIKNINFKYPRTGAHAAILIVTGALCRMHGQVGTKGLGEY